jgi:hypothetical protein
MPPPNDLQPMEILGRAVFDSKHVKNALRGVIPPKVFLERAGENEMSVDRMDYADPIQAAQVQTRLRGRSCRGWAVLSLEVASEEGRQVFPDPIEPDQLCHAYILLPFASPIEPEKAFAIQNTHAVQLAMNAAWRGAPEVEPSPPQSA